ncbi:MAG: glutamine amidotransferase [Desulfobulbaceae bacterium A2]|nr:MAG: glutamine amidotransferase [Desulfobulbaceae bacterium A2]
MLPVAVFTHITSEGPGYLADYLARRGIPWQQLPVDAGAAVPATPEDFSGLVFMGGPMSVNDDLGWIAEECTLIRAAMALGRPVLGHCLGAQLMAKALGASVGANPCKEMGWGAVRAEDNPTARLWLGDEKNFPAFHWHGETFGLPAGAMRILSGPHCANQGFVYDSLHLGLQCHVEMTEAMIDSWCGLWASDLARATGPGVQDAAAMRADVAVQLPRMRALADRLYDRWSAGLPR